jgi:hypothetical protein
LGELAAELTALMEVDVLSPKQRGEGRAKQGPGTLDAALENRLPDIYQRGLSAVSPPALRRLFRSPNLLIELQTRVLTAGGPYWDTKLQESAELTEMIDAGWSRLKERLFPASQAEIAPSLPIRPIEAKPTRPIRWFTAGLLTAAAAVALVAVGMWDRLGVAIKGPGENQVVVDANNPPKVPAPTGWGWSKAGALNEKATKKEYLNALADAAKEWHNKTPTTPAELAKRIGEMRQGCSQLILADHRPLPPADKAWLIERCKAWAKKFDDSLAELESGKDVTTVRKQMDTTIDTLIARLRERATT